MHAVRQCGGTARFYAGVRLPILYRVHEGPQREKLENLRAFLGELGLDLAGGAKPTPLEYQQMLQEDRRSGRRLM